MGTRMRRIVVAALLLLAAGFAAALDGPRIEPRAAKIPDLPDDTQTVVVGGVSYYYMGDFYNQQSDGYSVIQAPNGAMVSYLPEGYTTKNMNGGVYYTYDGVYYQAKMVDGGTAYVVTQV